MSGKFMMNGIEYLGGGSGGGGGNVDDVYVNGESVLDGNKIAQVTSYKEVTLAEYMALPDTKLSDGIMYCIKDVGGANQFPPLIYSDEEREVGVWRDGKPLYQKTFIKQLSGTATQIDISSINPETIFIYTGYYDMGVTKLSLNEWMGNSIYTYTHINPTSQHYSIDCHCSIAQNTTIHITVQYTKTTDVAGSGTWTTQGGYTHHYSTDEKVIGTWIDGKPLYEKTFALQSSQTIAKSAWTSVNIDLTDVKAIIDKRFINSSDGANTGGGSIVLKSNNQLLVGNEQGYDTMVFDTIILQYTKTTD